MTSAQFDAEPWIERLAQLLPPLARVQKPFLHEYQERYGRVIKLRDGGPPPFPLEDLRLLYDEVRDSRPWGLEAHYTPLRAVLDPVRHGLLGHPALARVAVAGRLIGDNRFSMEIPGSCGCVISYGAALHFIENAVPITKEADWPDCIETLVAQRKCRVVSPSLILHQEGNEGSLIDKAGRAGNKESRRRFGVYVPPFRKMAYAYDRAWHKPFLKRLKA